MTQNDNDDELDIVGDQGIPPFRFPPKLLDVLIIAAIFFAARVYVRLQRVINRAE